MPGPPRPSAWLLQPLKQAVTFARQSRRDVSLEFVNTLLVLGAAQGLFLAVLLATKQTNHTANQLLAAAMLAFSLFILMSLYYARGVYRAYPQLIGTSVPLVYVFGPILYLYARTVSAGGHTFRKASLLHFLPFALVTLYLLPFYLQDGPAKLAYLERLMREGPPRDLAIIQNLQYPHGIFYVILTIGLLRHHRTRLRDTHSYLERVNLLWLRNLTIGIVAVWALATGLHLVELTGHRSGELESALTPLAVSFLVYAIGYLGLRQPEIFHRPPEHTSAQPLEKVPLTGAEPIPFTGTPDLSAVSAPGSPEDESAGYEKSGLTHAQAEAHLQRLLQLMEERKLYRNSLLTLQDLADELRISAHHLSQVINTQLEKNFYDFVNGYRVEEIKQRLRDPKASHLTILAIALESGFNTKSSFNAFFKKYTGLTPSQYRAQDREAA